MVYLVNVEVDGYKTLDIMDSEFESCSKDTVAVVLDEQTSNYLYNYYTVIRNLLINKNRVILIMVDGESKIRKQLCMLTASYKNYDIYTVKSKDNIDSEYIETILERQPTMEEVETFIGADITAYSEMNEILLKLCDSVSVEDIDRVAEIVYQNKEMIQCFPSIIDYMKKAIDNYSSGLDSKVVELKEKIEKVENEALTAKLEAEAKKQELEEALEEIKGLKREIAAANQRCDDLEKQLGASGPLIKTYSTVNTSLIKCKVKSVLYFKEISSVRYINSFTSRFFETLSKIDNLSVKLLIYDNSSIYNVIYKPLPVISMSDYLNNREQFLTKIDKIVIIEPNKVILEEMLGLDYDCIIIYDRLKQAEDLVTGNIVYKYWVINSMKQIIDLDTVGQKIDRTKIITHVGVCPEALAISEIPAYKGATEAAKISKYVHMENVGKTTGRVFDIIKERTNLRSIINAKSAKR